MGLHLRLHITVRGSEDYQYKMCEGGLAWVSEASGWAWESTQTMKLLYFRWDLNAVEGMAIDSPPTSAMVAR